MAIKAGELVLGVRADTEQAKRDVQAFEKQVNASSGSIGSELASLGKKFAGMMGIALGAKALVDFGKSCIDLGSDLAEVQNVVDVVFPHMNETVNEWAMNASHQFGLSETMAKRYIGTFGSMAEAFGFTEAEALSMSETLTGLAGDVASFYNISQDEAYTKLKSVFSGETETLKELGIVMTQSALDQYALANGIGRTTASMSEAEKVALRYKFVQEQLTNASGDFANTSGSWANQVRLLSLQFQSLKASIGQGLIQVLTPVVQALNTLMAKLVQAARAFSAFLSVFGLKQQNPIGVTAQKTKQLSSGLGDVGNNANNATKGLKKANKEAKKLQRTIAGFDQINKLQKADTGSTAGNSGSSGAGGSGVGGLDIPSAEKINPISDAVDKFRKKWNKFLKNNPQLVKAFRSLKSALNELFGVFKSAGKWVWNNILKPLGKWLVTKLAPVVIKALAMAVRAVSKALKLIAPVLKAVWKIMKPMFKALGDVLVIQVGNLGKAFESLGDKFQDMAPNVKEVWENIGNKWSAVTEKMSDINVAVYADVVTTASELKDKIGKVLSGAGNIIKKIILESSTTAGGIKKKIKTVLSDAGKITKNIIIGIATTAKGLGDKVTKIIGKVKKKTLSIGLKFSAAASDLKSWVNANVISKINAKFSKIPILKNHLIPKLAQGGYVKANTPQLAMIGDNRHQGEFVAPESKLEEMARQVANSANGGDSAEVVALLRQIVSILIGMDLTATVSGQDLTNMVVRLHNQKAKATGKSPLYI